MAFLTATSTADRAFAAIGVWSLIVALACVAATTASAQDVPIVTAIEAVYLTKFMPFVDWPVSHAATERETICVLDDDAIAAATELAEGKAIAPAVPMAVRRLSEREPASGCHVLFIGNHADAAVVGTALAAVATAQTLTVTNRDDDGPKGIINFVIRSDRVRFEIDDAEAARHKLKISSKLLNIAIAVKPRS